MKSNKTSTSISKTAEKSVAPKSEPVKRTTKSSTAAKPTTTPASSKPKAAAHKHSKLSVPVAPIVTPAAATPAPAVASLKLPDHDAIARLAHSFWVERNYAHGFAAEDWRRAEKALSASA